MDFLLESEKYPHEKNYLRLDFAVTTNKQGEKLKMSSKTQISEMTTTGIINHSLN